MGKMHELLAAESGVVAAYNLISEETVKTFSKPDHFTKMVTHVKHFDDSKQNLDTSETRDNVTTVDERVKYQLGKNFVNLVDLLASKDITNQSAKADVILDGKVILTGLPATYLLTLETKLAQLRKVFENIPTLAPGLVWNVDATENLFKSDPATTFKTEKSFKVVSLAKATDKHPEQVDKISVDTPVAKIERTVWSGMWTSTKKSEILGRLDDLTRAVKEARQRANCEEVKPVAVGSIVAKYLLG